MQSLQKIKNKTFVAKSLITNPWQQGKLAYITESSQWAIRYVGYKTTQNLKESNNGKAFTTTTTWGLTKKLIHFGSLHTILKNGKIRPLSKKNKHIISIFHIIPNKYTSQTLNTIAHNTDLIHTSCNITKNKLVSVGISPSKIKVIPLGVDTAIFKPASNHQRKEIRAKLGIPSNSFVIGSFQKDGVGWNRGLSPKLEKGPDIFVKVIIKIAQQHKIHILLVGPARGYITTALNKANIPYTDIGYLKNTEDVAPFYSALDTYLITARHEGGPLAILEAWCSNIPVVSTKVGMVPDIATHKKNALLASINNINQLTHHLEQLILNKSLRQQISRSAKQQGSQYSWKKIAKQYNNELYKKNMKLHIAHPFIKGPYGGGNQFLKSLKQQLIKTNQYTSSINKADAILINMNPGNLDWLLSHLPKIIRKHPKTPIIARLDGPISLIRNTNNIIDQIIAQITNLYCDGIVFQSRWSKKQNEKISKYKVNFQTIISNATDPNIFFPSLHTQTKNKIKIIATSWSPNPRKGFKTYQYLDNNLDFTKYQFTFIGNSPIKFKNIKKIAPMPSFKLAKQLRAHDIFITASENDPCSNSLLEAMSCGLAIAALQSGGHPEIIPLKGELFNNSATAITTLNKIADNIDHYQTNLPKRSITKTTEQYISFATKIKKQHKSFHLIPNILILVKYYLYKFTKILFS